MKNDSQFSPKEPGDADLASALGWAWVGSVRTGIEVEVLSVVGTLASAGALASFRAAVNDVAYG